MSSLLGLFLKSVTQKPAVRKFHLIHKIPLWNHGANGYKEVIDSIRWGLEQLGNQATYSVTHDDNKVAYERGATNIFFGAQTLSVEALSQLPSDTIIYNLEQFRGHDLSEIIPSVHFYSKHFQVWEYSHANLEIWEKMGNTSVKYMPVGYAPVLTRISKPIQDIDVLIYGSTCEKRLNVFHQLTCSGLSCAYLCGLYGDSRDSLIARSKIILNVNTIDRSQIFEIVRVSYLLANKKAVISVLDERTYIEDDIKSCVEFTSLENLVEDCLQLIKDNEKRATIENIGFQIFSRRDIRSFLINALN